MVSCGIRNLGSSAQTFHSIKPLCGCDADCGLYDDCCPGVNHCSLKPTSPLQDIWEVSDLSWSTFVCVWTYVCIGSECMRQALQYTPKARSSRQYLHVYVARGVCIYVNQALHRMSKYKIKRRNCVPTSNACTQSYNNL